MANFKFVRFTNAHRRNEWNRNRVERGRLGLTMLRHQNRESLQSSAS